MTPTSLHTDVEDEATHGLLGTALAAGLVLPAMTSMSEAAGRKKCHSSYKGQCLKRTAYDYDCRGGTGDGPRYTGRVRVVGPDVFGLDRDGDGIGCEDE